MGELERKLNAFWKDSEDELYTFKVRKVSDIVTIKCFDDLDNLDWELEVEYNSDMLTFMTNVIRAYYDTNINCYSKVVKAWKGYSNRKIKSLSLAMSKNDENKIKKINLDLVDQYKRMSAAKFEYLEIKYLYQCFIILKLIMNRRRLYRC